MVGDTHTLLGTILHGDFWKEGGEGEAILVERDIPENLRDVVRDLAGEVAQAIADNAVATTQEVMATPGLREEYLAHEDGWDDEEMSVFKAEMIAFGLPQGGRGR